MEEFFERVMIAASKINPDPDEQFKRIWFLNGLRKELAKYVALLPSDDLTTAKTSARKVEICVLKKERMRDESATEESSKNLDDDRKKKKKKTKGKRIDTKEKIKALREELKGIALGDQRYRTGVVCRRCRNLGHYVQKGQMKQCINCNSLTHNTNECVYERHEARRPRE